MRPLTKVNDLFAASLNDESPPFKMVNKCEGWYAPGRRRKHGRLLCVRLRSAQPSQLP
jgi:hypothetical protein